MIRSKNFKGLEIETDSFANKFSAIVVDYSRSGTHREYNVVYNSECVSDSFESEDEAYEAGLKHLLNYLFK